MRQFVLSTIVAAACVTAFAGAAQPQPPSAPTGVEKHLKNIRQLTHGGENAEAYFSADGKRLIFQSTRQGVPCDQIFTINIDGSGERMVSNGSGRTTCAYYYPAQKEILYASTHEAGKACPPKPSYER